MSGFDDAWHASQVDRMGPDEIYGDHYADGRPVLCAHDCGEEATCPCVCCAAGHAGEGLCVACCKAAPVCGQCRAQSSRPAA